MSALLHTTNTDGLDPRPFLDRHGEVFATFDQHSGSGNLAFGLRCGDARFFIKTAGRPDDPRPRLRFADRVALLENAVRLYRSLSPPHPALARLRQVIASPGGPLLVYDWAAGMPLQDAARVRLHAQPLAVALRILDQIYSLHRALAAEGWIAVDFYDGSLLHDPVTDRLTVIDLDLYRRGPFRNQMGRMFGSSRFMAPEEFQRGARIDQRTTVFVLGRTARVLAPELGIPAVIVRACAPDPRDRFETVAALVAAWEAHRQEEGRG